MRDLNVWYYFRDGTMTRDLLAWAEKAQDTAYRRIAETTLSNGKWVSTVWLGIDHSFGTGPPLIFETMVFAAKSGSGDVDCERYSTEAAAIAGHAAMVAKWSGPTVSTGEERTHDTD